MDFKELSEKRYSVRTYLPKEVEKEKIDYILECARLAPSACNFQPWILYIVNSDEKRNAIIDAYNRDWFKSAPLYIVVCGDHSKSWKRTNTDQKDHCDIDAAIISEHICLAAQDIGLGTCWVCNFDPDLLRNILDLPKEIDTIAIFPIGYVDELSSKIPDKKRKDISEITRWV